MTILSRTPPNANKTILGSCVFFPIYSRCVCVFVALRSCTLRLLGVATNNLDLVGGDGLTSSVHLECDILDEECPDFVAESVRVEAPLRRLLVIAIGVGAQTHLELESRLDVLLERFRDGLVKVAQDLHGELRVDALIADEVVERVGQSEADAARQVSLAVAKQRIATRRRTCFDGTARRMIARP